MNETMTETKQPITDALQTKCKACGGIMQYSPADEDLKCVYCGKSAELDKTAAEIEENDYNLNIPRYVDTFEEEEEVDILAVQKEIDSLEKELKEVQSKMKEYLKELQSKQ